MYQVLAWFMGRDRVYPCCIGSICYTRCNFSQPHTQTHSGTLVGNLRGRPESVDLAESVPGGWVDAADVWRRGRLWIMCRVATLLRRRLFAGTTLTGGRRDRPCLQVVPLQLHLCSYYKSLQPNQVAHRPERIPSMDCSVTEREAASPHVTSLFNDFTCSQLTSCGFDWQAPSHRNVTSPAAWPKILNHLSH